MQEHEKVALQLILMGVVIAMAKMLASSEKLTWRVVLGRAILNGFTTLGAGAVLVLSLIHISEPTRHFKRSRMPSSA